MGLVQLLILALVQGITEFLPISSSAHLILAPEVTGATDQGPLIDVMAHLGTLFAVLVYFRRDVGQVITGKLALLQGRVTAGGRLVLLIAIATPPVLIFGGLLYVSGLADALRDPLVIAWATLIFALPLWLADHYARQTETAQTLSYKGAFLIGVAQMFALIPGASRSGVTMTAARALSMTRSEAARFSMLMAVPVIAAFGLLAGWEAPAVTIVGVGGLGGLTTFSTLAVEVDALLAADRVGAALGYVGLTVVLGVGAAGAGLALAA
ncbi:MAG: undecaprenyl-diphosphate phosphatase [Oceanicaulis sp.]